MPKFWGLLPSNQSRNRLSLDEPWHGNVLLSCGPHKLEPNQQLQEFNADFVPWRSHQGQRWSSRAGNW